MNKYKQFLLAFSCILLLSGCGKNSISQTSEMTNNNEIVSNYIYNNEPKYIIAKRINNTILFGYMDKNGKEIVKPQYNAVGQYSEGVAWVQENKDNQLLYGLIDSQGNKILESEYDKISDFSEDLFAVKSAGKTGYINKKGKFIIYPKYDYGYVFKEGLAKVIVENKVGFINKKGDYVIYPKFDEADNITGFIGGFSIVKSNGKYIVINKTGEKIKTMDFDTVNNFSTDRYKISKNKKYGLIDALGNVILEPKYSSLQSLDKDGKFIVFSSNNDKFGVMDKSFKEIISAKYSSNIFYNEGIIALYDDVDKKTLLFDTKGKLLARSDYKLLSGFSNNLCLVETNDAMYQGYINKKAEVVIPLKFTQAADFKNGLAFVAEAEEKEVIAGYIDIKGNYIWKSNTLYTPQDFTRYEPEQEAPQLQATTKKSVSTSAKKYSNNSNNYNYYDYDYGYYEPRKSQDFVEAESDILN